MKILNKLTIKYLLMNKKRTIVTIIGVILSTSLMVGIGLIVSSFRDSLIKDTKEFNGSQHIVINNIKDDKIIQEYDKISEYKKIYYIDEYEINNSYYSIISTDKELLNKFNYNGNLPNENEIIIPKSLKYEINEEIDINSKKYKVVGIYDNINSELPYEYSDYIYTTGVDSEYNTYFITFKDVKNAHVYIDDLVGKLHISSDDYTVNTELLALLGSIKYKNIMDTIVKIIIIVLALISVGCIIVIYNSFAISVMERKKQFGIFSSIGTTKSQLIKSVYFEALIISLIGIPLGILAAYLGIGIVISITNNLLSLGKNLLELSTYPMFIIIPIIFMIITVILSAFIPSIKASKISPIEAIRMNDDIKIKSKKVKTPKFIKKIFGIEGDLALKNIKRNKKKYRVTIISLFISIVLFITFSSFINYIFNGVKYVTNIPDIDIYITGKVDENSKKIISKNKDIEEYLDIEMISINKENDNTAILYIIDEDTYNKLLKEIGGTTRKPIVPNNYKKVEYIDGKRITKVEQKMKEKENIKLCFNDKCNIEFNDYYLPDTTYDTLDSFMSGDLYIFLTKDMLTNYNDFDEIDSMSRYNILIKTKNDKELESFIKTELNLDESGTGNGINLYNIREEYRLQKNIIIVIKIFVYGFIALVTLIGVTSVINTINTSIALRRKEFAILRSIGLDKKGFNKMIYFESLFFGLKSLLYALPVSGVIIYFIHTSMNSVIEYQSIMLPITQMIYAIIGVFVIVSLTMLYASRKIKKDNILEAIREENI